MEISKSVNEIIVSFDYLGIVLSDHAPVLLGNQFSSYKNIAHHFGHLTLFSYQIKTLVT